MNFHGDGALPKAVEAIENGATEIDLRSKKIGDEGATALANALASNESLHTLFLYNSNFGDKGATALANALASNESLQTLSLESNNIGDEGASALANALVTNEALHTLALWENNICDKGATALANALVKNETLHTLALESNNIDDEGASALANALVKNEALHTLALWKNNIGDDGASALANALVKNEALHTLALENNNIGDEGAIALANALASNESLHTLNLKENKIGAEGATALANALANNESLHTLIFDGNNIGNKGATALENALARNKTLQTLTIDYNNPALEAALESNRALYEQSLTPLMQACKKGDLASAKELVADGAHIDARDDLGLTPMVHACDASDNEKGLIIAKLLFENSAGLSSESFGLKKALAHASSKDCTEIYAFLSFLHSLPLANADTKCARRVVLNLFQADVRTVRTARGLSFSRLSTLGISDLNQRISFVTIFAIEPEMSALEALAAQASLARKMRSETRSEMRSKVRSEMRSVGTFDQYLSLQDEIAKAIGPKSPIVVLAKFDAQQLIAKKQVEKFETFQGQVRDAPERAPERNQAREEAVRLIEEALADGSEGELEKLRKEFVSENVLDKFREVCSALTGVEPTLDLPPDDVVTPERVHKITQKTHDALKAWMEQNKTRLAYERTVAAMDRLNEKAACATFLMYPKKRRELAPNIRAIEVALTEEVNVLCAADTDADADVAQDFPSEALQLELATMTAFYERFLAFSIMRLISAAMELGQWLSRLKPGLSSPSTEDVQRLFDVIQSKTRKRKRLALDLEDAREDARRGTEDAKARVVRLEEELTQIGNVYKLDSELRRTRARVLRHAEEHYPELIHDRTWLESIDVTDPATQKLSELGLLLTNAKRKDFQELAHLASSPGKSVQKVRRPDGGDLVLKAFHLGNKEESSRFYRQVTALAQLQSAYIVRIQGVFMQDAHQGCILMPFYEGGDLANWIVDNPHAEFATRRRIAIGLLSGLHDLHSRGLVHCDIKPGNVFLAKGLSPVLGDFDGVQMHDVTMTQPLQTTIRYMAPELRHGNVDKVEPAVDMFSVGVVLAELFEDTKISDATQSLVSSLQSADPSQRPTALAALRHEAFQVEPVKVASCTICLDNWLVREGVSCADGHFTCRECLSESVRAAAQPQACVNLQRDGSMRCVTPNCDHVVSGRSIAAAVPDEDFAALLNIVRAHFEQDAAAEQERQLRHRVDAALREHGLDPTTQNHIRTIQDEVLAISCPRCSAVFADFDGCCALKCGACSCYFCAWCLQDTGDDIDACHQHVARCASKPAGEQDPLFSEFAIVQQVWARLRAQSLREYLADIQDAGVRADVQRRLRPLITSAIVDETPEYQYDAFLTHDWGENGANHEFVRLVNAKLQSADKVTWFDGERLRGDIVQQITHGIENSRKVVVFITERYMHKLETGGNDYCRDEFMTAVRIHTPARMIAVVLEAAMLDQSLWRGPLQFSLGGHLYIDFTTPAKHEENFSFLLDCINA